MVAARFLRKHRTALIALAVYHFVIFFPVFFLGRALSPNDVYFNFSPWSDVRPAAMVHAQNSLLNDPPTAYYTLMSLVKDDWRTFHWNPYIACGVPGFGSSAAAVLSPLILIPLLAVPLTWVYTAIVFLKLNAAFLFAWLWLREEKMGRRASAIGAIVVAAAGVYAVRWLWQTTNVTVLYPALLWLIRRAFNGRRSSIALMTLAGIAYAVAGFPAAMAYGAYLVVAYTVVLLVTHWRNAPWTQLAAMAAAALLAIVIALPSLVPFVQLVRRSGYLEVREVLSRGAYFPPAHWLAFLFPDRLGNPAFKNWVGGAGLGVLNNYVESTVYLGLLTLPLVFLALWNRRARARWFWFATAALLLACMFGAPGLRSVAAMLPGIKYSALSRLGFLLPLPAGYLAAAGMRPLLRFAGRLSRRRPAFWREVAVSLVAIVLSFDLALLAGRFYPYLLPERAGVPSTPTIDFLQHQPGPFRIAPFFDFLWPNTSELLRLEDVRSHFGSEALYRRLLQRIDPTSWSGTSTVINFNSLKFNFTDPATGLLGIRYYLEHKGIDIIKWSVFGATTPGVQQTGTLFFGPDAVLERTVRIEAEPFWAIEVPVRITAEKRRGAYLALSLAKDGRLLWRRNFSMSEANALNKMYVPLRSFARYPQSVTLRVESHGLVGSVLEGVNASREESRLFYGRVMTPVVFDRELPDGRIFRNLAELPRFRGVTRVRKLNDDEFLAAKEIDFEREAVITDDPVMPPELIEGSARVTLVSTAADEQRVETESATPFYLASSEKLTPELAITIDGHEARPVRTDLVFSGVTVPAGKHQVVFTRRIARGIWWPLSAAGLVVWLVTGVYEVLRRPRALLPRPSPGLRPPSPR